MMPWLILLTLLSSFSVSVPAGINLKPHLLTQFWANVPVPSTHVYCTICLSITSQFELPSPRRPGQHGLADATAGSTCFFKSCWHTVLDVSFDGSCVKEWSSADQMDHEHYIAVMGTQGLLFWTKSSWSTLPAGCRSSRTLCMVLLHLLVAHLPQLLPLPAVACWSASQAVLSSHSSCWRNRDCELTIWSNWCQQLAPMAKICFCVIRPSKTSFFP